MSDEKAGTSKTVIIDNKDGEVEGSNPAGPSNGQKRKAEDSDEVGITMLDVLQDEEAMEEDAKAVLGNADDKNCSYHSGGYMKRQALYACVTCSVPGSQNFEPAALCLACSYHCHASHEIVELYTKRHFRCDCGNRKLKHNVCKLANDKTPLNESNSYNQNFQGVYCTCHRPYPDPEDETPDQMIQCIICEDWYHGRHLQGISSPPNDDTFAEMICHLCYEQNKDVLLAYRGLAVIQVEKNENRSDVVDVCDGPSPSKNGTAQSPEATKNNEGATGKTETPNSAEKSETLKIICPFKSAGNDSESAGNDKVSALFLPGGWRDQLCKCDDCQKLYSDKKIEFLLDPEDTVHFYESQALNEGGTQYEEGMKALGEMDRVQQMEAITGYNEMKESLKKFLKTFADEGKVVTKEDIQEFFQNMKSAKRLKVEIPKFCR